MLKKNTVGYTISETFECLEDLQQVHNMKIIYPFCLDYCGREKCKPRHSFGPYIRESYCMHFVINGKGTYEIGKKKYELGKGMIFCIPPGVTTTYYADKDDPWEYLWIGFHGIRADIATRHMGFTLDSPVRASDILPKIESYLTQLFECKDVTYVNEFKRMAILCNIVADLSDEYNQAIGAKDPRFLNTSNTSYVEMAIATMVSSYMKPIKITDIADYIGINRSYLTDIFTKEMGMSPKQFLMDYRLEKASELLLETDDSIHSIALSVGYSDQLSFSKAFKKKYNENPTDYRNNKVEVAHVLEKGYQAHNHL